MLESAAPASESVTGQAVPVLSLENVYRIYGSGLSEVRAMDGVDLTVNAGEFIAMTGPSGAGKSTCLNVLGCLDRITGGRYLFQGTDVASLNRRQLALLRRYFIGFVFQGFNLLHRTTALENVELPLIYRRVPRRERRQRAEEMLALVGLQGREDHTPAELSGGQQQRVAIARAMVTSPSVVLADEPTGNLDTRMSGEIMQLLTRLNREHGLTIVMVTHEADIAAYAHREVQFRDGRIAADIRNEAHP